MKHVAGRTVERTLDYAERATVINALQFLSVPVERGGAGKMDWLTIMKIDRTKRMLNIEELVQFQESLETKESAALSLWNCKEKESPGSGGPKPKVPEKETRGKPNTFVLTLAADGLIREALKATKWSSEGSQYVSSTMGKFGISLEDPEWKVD